MEKKISNTVFFIIFTLFQTPIFAQIPYQIKGIVSQEGEPIAYATLYIKNTTYGTLSDENGVFDLTFNSNTPEEPITLVVKALGYMTEEKNIGIKNFSNGSITIDITLREDIFDLNEIVVSGTRTERKRTESAVMVDLLNAKTLELTLSTNLAQGLCFQPGLRVEVDCQTCNYTQLRMNGLGGNYSQILINSRPVFSALNGLYGLEQIPANMIERVEVVRGGGSAMFGSNAIAGTVNIITKEPKSNTFQWGYSHSLINDYFSEEQYQLNNTWVSKNNRQGHTLFANLKMRDGLDMNADGFTEIPKIENYAAGLNSFFKIGTKTTLKTEFFGIKELRRGGDQLNLPAQLSEQAEERLHHIFGGGFSWQQVINPYTDVTFYASALMTQRKHYTGIDQADAWGDTKGQTAMAGAQISWDIPHFLGTKQNTITAGIEYQYDKANDQIPLYDWYLNQTVEQLSLFAQMDWRIHPKWTWLIGGRLDRHNKVPNKAVLNPRTNLLFQATDDLQFRISWATGFRAPQALDADLHMAFASGGVALVNLNPELKPENSQSYTFSVNYDKAGEKQIWGFTASAFHTTLYNAFALAEVGTSAQGNMLIERRNAGMATVRGFTLETRWNYNQIIQLENGFTFQQSFYDTPIVWSQELAGEKRFLRTPEYYGYYTLQILPQKKLNYTFAGIFTGEMFVPHFAGAEGITNDELKVSPFFWEQTLRINYTWKLNKPQWKLQLSLGVQNIWNAYQKDFDIGKNRDSNYIYGPARPRTWTLQLRLMSWE
ncbi:MAG: TonB-dependent receptor [Cytophagales bacterium]|nr:MAG: TonB-dependent receptor [Cytophagales bacterium]